MEEIKFRLRIDNKIVGYEKWYSGHQVERDPCSAQPCWLYSKDGKNWSPEYIYHRSKDQFIGLKDKNGKEIYEGDMVRVDGYYIGDSFIEENTGEVKYGNGSFMIDYEFSPILCEEEIYNCNIEIIGSLYENPELKVQ